MVIFKYYSNSAYKKPSVCRAPPLSYFIKFIAFTLPCLFISKTVLEASHWEYERGLCSPDVKLLDISYIFRDREMPCAHFFIRRKRFQKKIAKVVFLQSSNFLLLQELGWDGICPRQLLSHVLKNRYFVFLLWCQK